jgi:hypothetical protein
MVQTVPIAANASERLGYKSMADESAFIVGESYLVRTVTYFVVGRLRKITTAELVFDDAAWVASTGRFHDALRDGTLEAVEPFLDPVIVNRGAIVDATNWRHPLPLEQTERRST